MNKEQLLQKYLENARGYIGTPFKHQGRDKNGMDCIGIIVVPLNEVGFFKYDNRNYRRYGLGGEIKEILSKYCYEVTDRSKFKAGDILLFSKNKSQHLAIYTDNNTIIHSNNFVGKVVEHSLDDEWKNRITKVYRYKGD